MPHLTIAKMGSMKEAECAFATAQERWAAFSGLRQVHVEELTFVREKEDGCWIDLASVPLRRILVPQA